MKQILFILFAGLLLVGCGENAGQKEIDYDQTKKMVVDILQTEDGKKALVEVLRDEQVKNELVMQSDTVKTAIDESLNSDQGTEMWKRLFEDPSFVEGYTESISDAHMDVMKDLMSDAEYQKQMLELLQNPELTTLFLSTMKSQQFRAHLEETIQQTLDTPLFQAKMQEILLKAAEEMQSQEGGGGSEQESSDGGSGSEQGEDGGGEAGSGEGGGSSSE